MTTMPDPCPESLSDTALEWLVRLYAGDASEADWQAYAVWKTANPEQAEAARQAEQLWRQLGAAADKPLSRLPGAGALAALVLVAGLSGLIAGGVFGPPAALIADYSTGTGERQTVMLPDGSRLELDAGTRVDVDMQPGRRQLTLYSGQLHVQVSPDPGRPFDVEAAGGRIRALGTAFNVRHRDSHVEVAVTEHAVRVSTEAGSQAVLQEGQRLQYGQQTLGTASTADLTQVTAWQRGYLVFDDQPLAEVVREIGHYRPGLLFIRGDALKSLRVTGVFQSRDPDALLTALADLLPVRIRQFPGLTLIEAQPGDGA